MLSTCHVPKINDVLICVIVYIYIIYISILFNSNQLQFCKSSIIFYDLNSFGKSKILLNKYYSTNDFFLTSKKNLNKYGPYNSLSAILFRAGTLVFIVITQKFLK